jgi:hypothetical protein
MHNEHSEDSLRSVAQIAKQPIHPILIPVPIVCFTGASAIREPAAHTAIAMATL